MITLMWVAIGIALFGLAVRYLNVYPPDKAAASRHVERRGPRATVRPARAT